MAFVPQGLPATVTMLLTFAAMRLKDVNVLVKDLTAVDTLGTITLLASDKTGTLTVNRMTVVDVWINGELLSTTGAGDEEEERLGPRQKVGLRVEGFFGGGVWHRMICSCVIVRPLFAYDFDSDFVYIQSNLYSTSCHGPFLRLLCTQSSGLDTIGIL